MFRPMLLQMDVMRYAQFPMLCANNYRTSVITQGIIDRMGWVVGTPSPVDGVGTNDEFPFSSIGF